MPDFIATADLSLDQIPLAFCSWADVVQFASTFDIHSEDFDSKAAYGADVVSEESTVASLRAALYGEWRRYNSRSDHPNSELLKKVWRILEWIRRDVARRSQ